MSSQYVHGTWSSAPSQTSESAQFGSGSSLPPPALWSRLYYFVPTVLSPLRPRLEQKRSKRVGAIVLWRKNSADKDEPGATASHHKAIFQTFPVFSHCYRRKSDVPVHICFNINHRKTIAEENGTGLLCSKA